MKIQILFLLIASTLLISQQSQAQVTWSYPVDASPISNIAFKDCVPGRSCVAFGNLKVESNQKFPFEVMLSKTADHMWEGQGVIQMRYGDPARNRVDFTCSYPIRLFVKSLSASKMQIWVDLAQQIPVAQNHCAKESEYTDLSRRWGPSLFQ